MLYYNIMMATFTFSISKLLIFMFSVSFLTTQFNNYTKVVLSMIT